MEPLAFPAVAAIVERTKNGEREILLQTRWKPKVSPKYTGLLEIPAGAIKAYEDLYDAVKREVEEETGLRVKRFRDHERSKEYDLHDDNGFAFRPFCCEYMSKGAPFLCVVFIVEVEDGEPVAQDSETRDPHWVLVKDLKHQFREHPERFFTLHCGALELYLREQ